MKNKILLSTLLLASLAVTQSAFAATSDTQIITGQLSSVKSVVGIYTPAELTKAITPNTDTSATLTAIAPAFTVTGTHKNDLLTMSASCAGVTGPAIFGVGTAPHIVLLNSAQTPGTGTLQDSFDNAKNASPTATLNEGAIAFPITVPVAAPDSTTPTAALSYTANGTNGWTGKIDKGGVTRTDMTISGPSSTGTFSYGDEAGDYVSTILLSFN